MLRAACVWETTIRLGLGKKADVITAFNQQQGMTKMATGNLQAIQYNTGVPN